MSETTRVQVHDSIMQGAGRLRSNVRHWVGQLATNVQELPYMKRQCMREVMAALKQHYDLLMRDNNRGAKRAIKRAYAYVVEAVRKHFDRGARSTSKTHRQERSDHTHGLRPPQGMMARMM